MTLYVKIAVAGLLTGGLAAGAIYWYSSRTKATPEVVAPAAAQSQPDGSVVLERMPEASAPVAAAKPKAKLPKGSRVERQVSVTVAPKIPAQSAVTVDMSLVQDSAGGRRVVASSPDGTVVSGIDIPIERVLIPITRKWAAGVSCDAAHSCAIEQAGIWVDRDIGRVRLGVEGTRESARIKIGLTF